MAYIYDIADTWAASGTVFTGIKLNVTDTASAAGSLLMDLQVGGSSKFSVGKNGYLGILSAPSGSYLLLAGGPIGASQYACTSSTGGFYWDSANSPGLFRDGNNSIAQRNGVNAQAFNLYNTYTDASNYERGFMRFVSNVLQIGTQKLGTGAARALEFQTDGTTRLTIATTGAATFSSTITIFGNEGFWGSGVLGLPGTGGQLKFSTNTVAVSGSGWDAGLARASSGVLKVTNGSTGTGQLIFIVPTTDPGITGALWNNLGVLSISA